MPVRTCEHCATFYVVGLPPHPSASMRACRRCSHPLREAAREDLKPLLANAQIRQVEKERQYLQSINQLREPQLPRFRHWHAGNRPRQT